MRRHSRNASRKPGNTMAGIPQSARASVPDHVLVQEIEGQSAVRGAAALSLSEVLADPELVGDIREGA